MDRELALEYALATELSIRLLTGRLHGSGKDI